MFKFAITILFLANIFVGYFAEACVSHTADHESVSASVSLHDCHGQSTNQSSDDSKNHSHERCEFHCTHQYVIFKFEIPALVVPDVNHRSNYLLSVSQTILEGPFRPPLV